MSPVNHTVLVTLCTITPYTGPVFGLGACDTGVSSFGRYVIWLCTTILYF